MIYKCCFSGCNYTVDVGEHDDPRHQHGKAFVEMRKPVEVGAMFYQIKPGELKASGGEVVYGN